jgi:lysocardiolipin and lysophospholipid acyltransferase
VNSIPLIGTGANLLNMIFLKRNWTEDEHKIESMFSYLIENQVPVYITIFPEGTRISVKKYQQSVQFAQERNIKPLQQVLIPRRRGLEAMIKHLRKSHVKHVYDITSGYLDGRISTSSFLSGDDLRNRKMLVNVKRWKIEDIPLDDENEFNDWLMDQFYRKDRLISTMHETRHFKGEPIVK